MVCAQNCRQLLPSPVFRRWGSPLATRKWPHLLFYSCVWRGDVRVAWGQFKGRDEVSLKVHWVKIRDEVPPRPELVWVQQRLPGRKSWRLWEHWWLTLTLQTPTTWACLGTRGTWHVGIYTGDQNLVYTATLSMKTSHEVTCRAHYPYYIIWRKCPPLSLVGLMNPTVKYRVPLSTSCNTTR